MSAVGIAGPPVATPPVGHLLISESSLAGGVEALATPPPDPHGWARLSAFHAMTPRTADTPAPPEVEFHALLGTLADHPGLLVRLGLLRRLRVTLPSGVNGAVTIRAIPAHARELQDYRPRTQCVAVAGALRLPDGSDGEPAYYLPLDDITKFTAMDVDVDRSGLALRAYAAQLAGLDRASQPPPPIRLPALRSDGISVTETDRHLRVRDAVQRATNTLNADLEAGGDGGRVTLAPADLQRGYRVDVFDEESRRWYPLCRRVGTYRLRGVAAPIPVDDEGTVSEAITHATDADQDVSLAHESLFRWNGWSLVASPPGGVLDLDDSLVHDPPAVDPASPFIVQTSSAPGTLPALRYGRSYRLRARLVDIAGRSIPFDPTSTVSSPATPGLMYRRYNPIPPPVLVPRRLMTEGESAHILVVRTDNSLPDQPQTGPASERHLLPPKASVRTVELHGALDIPGEHRPDPNAYSLLVDRDRGHVTGTPDPRANNMRFVDADTIDLPWLPDPLARGLTMRGMPAPAELQIAWPRGASWHQLASLRLVVEPAGPSTALPVTADSASRTVHVPLPPGVTIDVLLSSNLQAGDEELMGAWHWYAQNSDQLPGLETARTDVLAGRVDQLCPAHALQLIHAVRCPLEAPRFGDVQAGRQLGETSYLVDDDQLTYHRDSTQSLDLVMSWTDTIDKLEQPGPQQLTGSADLVLDRREINSGTQPFELFSARHHIGNTRHHVVQCTPVATSRFAHYFTERRTVQLTGDTPTQVATAFVPGTVAVRRATTPDQSPPTSPPGAPTPAPATSALRLGVDVAVNHQPGQISRLPGGAVPDGSSVEVAFVAPPVSRAGPSVSINVPASARPAPPVVHSIVPAFAWTKQRIGQTIISTRHGGHLRVYLERPWFDSGEGELLAVLLSDAQFDPTDNFTSSCWPDPVFDTFVDSTALLLAPHNSINLSLEPSSFPRRVMPDLPPLSIPDAPPPDHTAAPNRIGAIGHTVQYDPDRQLWFANIEIDAPRVQPFVHLRLARLQPNAIHTTQRGFDEDLSLSHIVDTGFHQLPADRKLSVTLDTNQAQVIVTGPVPSSRVNQITASIQVGEPPGGDPALWRQLDELPSTTLTQGSTGWMGTVQLPPGPSTGPMRLLVREYQILASDPTGDVSPPAEPPTVIAGKRVTYFDCVDLQAV